MIKYEVVRQGRRHAVRRVGVRGGITHIAVYKEEAVADAIAASLNAAAKFEA